MTTLQYEEIPLEREVECSDGVCGRITSVVINPRERSLNYMVVRVNGADDERLVPADAVSEATIEHLKLRLSRDQAAIEPQFTATEHARDNLDLHKDGELGVLSYNAIGQPGNNGINAISWPITVQLGRHAQTFKRLNLPAGELALRRETSVYASDGLAGKLDGIIVDMESFGISRLVLRRGPSAPEGDIAIPYSAVTASSEDTIQLSLSRAEVAEMPTLEQLRRRQIF